MRHFGYILIALPLIAAGALATEHLDHNAMRMDLFGSASWRRVRRGAAITTTSRTLDRDARTIDRPSPGLAPPCSPLVRWNCRLPARKRRPPPLAALDKESQNSIAQYRYRLTMLNSGQCVACSCCLCRDNFRRSCLVECWKGRVKIFSGSSICKRIYSIESVSILWESSCKRSVMCMRASPGRTKPRSTMSLMQLKLADTEYARRAALSLETRQPLPQEKTECIGCHVPKREPS